MSLRTASLNNPITRDTYDFVYRYNPSIANDSAVVPPPPVIIFKMADIFARGIPMSDLLNPRTARFMDDAYNEQIKVFLDGGVPEIRLVIWGPERPRGRWDYHVRRIPVITASERLTNKAELGIRIAMEYKEFCRETQRRRDAMDNYEGMQFEQLTLIALRRLNRNVYQAELGTLSSSSLRQ